MVPMGPPRYRALSAGVVRKAVSKKSAKVGKLSAGEIIVSLGAEQLGDTLRVRFERGWVSATAGGSGKPLLERLPDEPLEGGRTLVASPSSSSLSSWGSADEGTLDPHTLCPLRPS